MNRPSLPLPSIHPSSALPPICRRAEYSGGQHSGGQHSGGRQGVLLVIAALLATVGLSQSVRGQWPDFRGPTTQGHTQARQLPTQWSETQNIRWKTSLPGRGWSSPVFADGLVWLTTAIEEQASPEEQQRKLAKVINPRGLEVAARVVLRALAVDRRSGELVHSVDLFTVPSPEPIHSLNSYASPSPVVDSGRVYCHFGTYGTACLDSRTGKVLWKNSELRIDHQNGPGSSPFLWKQLLIIHYDGIDEQYLVALHADSGKIAWKTERAGKMDDNPPFRKAYCTPIVVEHEGRELLISPAASWVYAYDPATGAEIWRANYGKLGFSNVARPVAGHGMVYVSSCFVSPTMCAIRYDGRGDVTDTHLVWKHDKQMPKMPSPVLVGEELYIVSDNGIATCLDALTGELVWRNRLGGNFCASPLAADGKIYFFNREGETFIIKAGRTFTLLKQLKLEGSFMSSPAVDGSDLLLRTDQALYRISTAKAPAAEAPAAAWKKHEVFRGGRANTAVVGDYTGDGKPDIIANAGGQTRLLAAPRWQSVVLDPETPHHLIHSETFDVDGDGDLDFIGAQYSPGHLFWLECPSQPLTQRWVKHLIDEQLNGIHGLLKADVDGDGKWDLLANSGQPVGTFANSAAWLKVPAEPREAQAWERHVFAAGDAPGLSHYLGAGDLNGDGRLDITLAAKGGPQDKSGQGEWFAWWEATSQPGRPFRKHVIADRQPGATNIHPADVDGDGRVDVIASRGHGRGVVWFAAPDWQEHVIDAELVEPHSLAVVDMDGDKDLDAVTCAYGSKRAYWYENDGRGNFKPHLIARDQAAYDIRVHDMDGDGDLDVVIAGQQSNNVVWCENPGKAER